MKGDLGMRPECSTEAGSIQRATSKNITCPISLLAEAPSFTHSLLDTLKTVIDDIKTEYFWVFSDFVDMKNADIYFVPDALESDQIHTWYKSGSNKEGNLLLIPTEGMRFLMSEADSNNQT